ncbi:molybdate ABC transporter substrate-binding protein [Peptoniphilus equinus]|uniref:Molybdate ABC transporter substrate-binding protein n=1 Tax=Peptoniphilus equinus TaxID=3016343 RepID=A0ABY7QTG2_9FIRM|nr:molybdate ABC transporter substrate-binding protein [Peptoniphilus equinus]WBW50064.1 molybdate ABC transporter substrate-binding protein [Peptoniphilus equinus]
MAWSRVWHITVLGCVFFLAACQGMPSGSTSTEGEATGLMTEQRTLTVAAAASLTESMEAVKASYEAAHPEVNIVYNFDSSGTLRTQLESGADFDVFVSASRAHMDGLNDEGLIATDTIKNMLSNEVVLAVRSDLKGVRHFEDLLHPDVKRIGLGNSDVPVGRYAIDLLNHLGIYDRLQDKVSWGSNAKEITQWVKEGTVDAAVLYHTDANVEDLTVVDTAGSADLTEPIVYPVAVVKTSTQADVAQAFVDYLFESQSRAVFEQFGFTTLDN